MWWKKEDLQNKFSFFSTTKTITINGDIQETNISEKDIENRQTFTNEINNFQKEEDNWRGKIFSRVPGWRITDKKGRGVSKETSEVTDNN